MTEQELIEYLRNELAIETTDVDADTALFSSGRVDSFSLVTLISHIEERCRFRMSPAEVNLENLDTVGRIVRFVAEKKNN